MKQFIGTKLIQADVVALFERENLFPVLEPRQKQQVYIPYNIIAPHEAQAMRNHSQTLQRLAERGGLSWTEILAVLKNKTWKEMGWNCLVTHQEADAREREAKEAVQAYVRERSASHGNS